MKKLLVVLILACVLSFVVAIPALAAAPTIVTVSWYESGVRYNPDGTVQSSWTSYLGEIDFLQTGQTYHVVNLIQMYSISVPDVKGSLIINATGKLSSETTYTSPVSLLPIRDLIKGNVTINDVSRKAVGTYIQYRKCFGSQADVLAAYPKAVPEKSPNANGWWFIDYTIYRVRPPVGF